MSIITLSPLIPSLGSAISLPEKQINEVQQESSVATSSSTTTTTTKAGEIFQSRALIRSRIRRADKIERIIRPIMYCIGIGAIVAGLIAALVLTRPLSLIALEGIQGLSFGGSLILTSASYREWSHPIERTLTDEEEKQFWNAIATNSLEELASKQLYFESASATMRDLRGHVNGICNVTFKELEYNDLMNPESAFKLRLFLQESSLVESNLTRLRSYIEMIRAKYSDAKDSKREEGLKKIAEQIKELLQKKSELYNKFETFRKAFLEKALLFT